LVRILTGAKKRKEGASLLRKKVALPSILLLAKEKGREKQD